MEKIFLENLIGKYCFVETRENNTKRVFIRHFTNIVVDTINKQGWWDLFSLADKEVKEKNKYIAKINSYSYDKDGYVNLHISIIQTIDDLKIAGLLFESSNQTWESEAINFMLYSGLFIDKTSFNGKLNFNELYKKLPEYDSLSINELSKVLCKRYFIEKSISLQEIEEALNKPTDDELVLDSLVKGYKTNNMDMFSEYSYFCKKFLNTSFTFKADIEDFLQYKLYSYYSLVKENKINDLNVGLLPTLLEKIIIANEVIKYREIEKIKIKEERKNKRKNK